MNSVYVSPMSYLPLPRKFYSRDTHVVAKELLGKLVVRRWRNQRLVGRITEVESYVGQDDLACHAAKGRTARTEVMFGRAGHAYVYLIYGMYHLLNIVTEQEDFPAAVLIRSLEPVEGISAMRRYRNTSRIANLTTGPGKLTQATHITRAQNGDDLTCGSRLLIACDGQTVSSENIVQGPRVGVDYAGADALLPWRYYLKHSTFVSQR